MTHRRYRPFLIPPRALRTYAVRVHGFNGAENTYDLTLSTTGPPSGICPPDDGFEDNDTRSTATAVIDGVTVSATVCDGDDDWFSLPVQSGDEQDAQLRRAVVQVIAGDHRGDRRLTPCNADPDPQRPGPIRVRQQPFESGVRVRFGGHQR
mgnify:CR=1 FL=1